MTDQRDENDQHPSGDEAREAVDSLRGYLYQVLASAIAWVRLPQNGRLYLEVADDYATLLNNKLTAVQVKDTHKSGSITLNTKGVKDAIKNFVKLVQDNPGLDIRQHYLSTSPIGKESKLAHRIDGVAGLEYWRGAALGSEIHPLREYLQSDRVDSAVKTYCQNRNDDQLRADLVSRISWSAGQPEYDELYKDLENELIEFGNLQNNLTPSEAENLTPVVIHAVLKCCIKPDRKRRLLTRADLLRIVETATLIPVPKQGLRELLKRSPASFAGHGWQSLGFGESRGWRPALLGQALVPSDVLICPQLKEVDVIINRLQRDYVVNVLGEPGSGKSICAFQVAHYFHKQGWNVFQQFSSAQFELPIADSNKTFYLIDDAHLLLVPVLQALVQLANSNRLFLFLHNALKNDFINGPRQSVYINAKRAVGDLAAYMRSHHAELLPEIRSLDKDVGLRMMDISLDRRINEAEREAQYPWQFCFIVSGGWQRAIESIEAAQSIGAEISMIAISIHQLGSRDARPSKEFLFNIAAIGNQSAVDFDMHLQWMLQQRLLIGPQDLRFPHQRFASVVLKRLLKILSVDTRTVIGAMLGEVMASPDFPLLGKRNVFSELEFDNWHRLIPTEKLLPPLQQCWSATSQKEIVHASFFIAETVDYLETKGIPLTIADQNKIVDWLNNVSSESANAISHLINRLSNRDKELVRAIISRTDFVRLGEAISVITPKSAYSLGSLLRCLGVNRDSDWGRSFIESIDRLKIQTAVSQWSGNGEEQDADLFALSSINEYLRSMQWVDEDFALSLCEILAPFVQIVWSKNPIVGFNCLDDVCWFSLRFFDGWKLPDEFQPDDRHFKIAKLFLDKIDPVITSDLISNSPIANFQSCTYFLSFVRRTNRALFDQIVALINWSVITQTIGEYWSGLPHEAEILLAVCWDDSTEVQLENVIRQQASKIEILPSRLALMFPSVAWDHLTAGKTIGMASHWKYGAYVIEMTAAEKPELLPVLLEKHIIKIAESLSRVQHSNDSGTLHFLKAFFKASPALWEMLMKQLDIQSARTVWRSSLRSNYEVALVPSFLIDCNINREDSLGELARALDVEFPHRLKKEGLLALIDDDQSAIDDD